MSTPFKIAIVGHGFVGKAVRHGFDLPMNDITIIDPREGTSVEDLYDKDIDFAFICVPTPMSDTGKIDSSIVVDVINKLYDNSKCLVVLKSTVTPDIVQELSDKAPSRFVYNPEFLTEANAEEDFINATFNVFGGLFEPTVDVAYLYDNNSKCVNAKSIHVSAVEASFIKYTINTFLSTKVTFFNQLKDQVDKFDQANYDVISEAVKHDPRIGNSHMMVPGPDGRRGFGGACFPKDTNAIIKTGQRNNVDLSILKEAVEYNSKIRKS